MSPHQNTSSWAIQARVIRAVLLREVITRFGRHNIGFFWLFLEPLLFTVGVVGLWKYTRSLHGLNIDVAPFVITGYSSILMWRNCSFRGLKAIESNRSLMHHRNVKVIDILSARMFLEIASVTASLAFVMTTLWLLDWANPPHDIGLMLQGWFILTWFSFCLGLILGCLSEYSEAVERIWHPTSYFMLSVSGAFFLVDWMPHWFRPAADYIPMLAATEMLRGGYYGLVIKTYYSFSTTAIVCLVLTLLSLVLIKRVEVLVAEKG